jgi:hypothetical protein
MIKLWIFQLRCNHFWIIQHYRHSRVQERTCVLCRKKIHVLTENPYEY